MKTKTIIIQVILSLLFGLGGSMRAMHPQASQTALRSQPKVVLAPVAQQYLVTVPSRQEAASTEQGQVERKVFRAGTPEAEQLPGMPQGNEQGSPMIKGQQVPGSPTVIRAARAVEVRAPDNSPAQRPQVPEAVDVRERKREIAADAEVAAAMSAQLAAAIAQPEFGPGDGKRKLAAEAEVTVVLAGKGPRRHSKPLTEAQRAVMPTSLLFSFVGYSCKAHKVAVTALTIMPNLVVSGAADGTVELWDSATGSLMGKFDLKNYGAINVIVHHKNSIAFGTDKGTLRGDSKNLLGGLAKWPDAGDDVVEKFALFYRGTKVSLKEIGTDKQGTFLINGHKVKCGVDAKTKAPLLVKSLDILNWEPLQLITVDNDNELRFHSSVDVFGADNTTGVEVVPVAAKDVGAIAVASAKRVCFFSQNNQLRGLKGKDSNFRLYTLESFHTDSAPIHSLCTSPGGHYIMSVSQSSEVVIRRYVDDPKRAFVTRFKLDKLPTALAISDAGEEKAHMVAFGYGDGTIEVRSIVDQIGLEDIFEKFYSKALQAHRQLYDDGWKIVVMSPDDLNELLERFPEGVIRDRALAMYYNKEAVINPATSDCCVVS